MLDYATLISFSDNHSDWTSLYTIVQSYIRISIILAQAHLGTNYDNRCLIMRYRKDILVLE